MEEKRTEDVTSYTGGLQGKLGGQSGKDGCCGKVITSARRGGKGGAGRGPNNDAPKQHTAKAHSAQGCRRYSSQKNVVSFFLYQFLCGPDLSRARMQVHAKRDYVREIS